MTEEKPKALPEDAIIPIVDMGIDLPLHNVRDLLAIFQEPGWKVLKEIWKEEEEASIDVGMSLVATEEKRAPHRGVYHKLQDLKCLPGNIQHSYDLAMGLAKDEDD